MTEETRTFSYRLASNYVPGTIIEIMHFRDLILDSDEKAAIYLEEVSLVLQLKNTKSAILPDYDGDETETEKVSKFNAAEERSERFGLQFLSRKNNTGDWDEDVEIICVNRGRKDYISLLQPFFTKYQVKILNIKDAYAIKLIDYGYGLLKLTDTVKVSIAVKVEVSKKNDTSALEARIATLELALQGKLIDLSANTLLGRDATSGTVMQISQSRFATPAMIDQAIIDLAGGAPGALNTLIELANALNNDANFASTVTNALALKAPLASPTFTGFPALGGNIGLAEKYITGAITGSAQGDIVTIPHGIALGKIRSISALVEYATNSFMPPMFVGQVGYCFGFYIQDSNIRVQNVNISGFSSNNILSKALHITIKYIQ
jgi:hypothetical protein